MSKELPDDLQKKYDVLIEDLQEAIIHSGGKFFRKSEVEALSIHEIFDIAVRNKISITIKR